MFVVVVVVDYIDMCWFWDVFDIVGRLIVFLYCVFYIVVLVFRDNYCVYWVVVFFCVKFGDGCVFLM